MFPQSDNAPTIEEELTARRTLPAPAVRRALRVASGLSRSRIAAEIGVTKQAVARWESGLSEPRPEHVVPYAALLSRIAGGR